MNLPTVTICVTTYFPNDVNAGPARRQVALDTIGTWARYLRYQGRAAIHIADDGSGFADWPDALRVDSAWRSKSMIGTPRLIGTPTTSRQERHGVGASLNVGFDVGERDGGIVLYAVDDWQLIAPLDITPWVEVLLDNDPRDGAPVGMVRLGPPHPWLTGTIQTFPSGWGMRLDRHHFAFGHRPALYHPRMREAYGRFAEDVNAYICEQLYAEHFCRTPGPDIVLALPDPWKPIEAPELELAHIDPKEG